MLVYSLSVSVGVSLYISLVSSLLECIVYFTLLMCSYVHHNAHVDALFDLAVCLVASLGLSAPLATSTASLQINRQAPQIMLMDHIALVDPLSQVSSYLFLPSSLPLSPVKHPFLFFMRSLFLMLSRALLLSLISFQFLNRESRGCFNAFFSA